MANYLRYTYQALDTDSALVVFDDVDEAKTIIDFDEFDFTGLSPEWTLENDDKTLVLKVPFTDAQAHVEMKAFHENVKDSWAAQLAEGYSEIVHSVDNKYVVGDTEI
jgi:hypothetical protein